MPKWTTLKTQRENGKANTQQTGFPGEVGPGPMQTGRSRGELGDLWKRVKVWKNSWGKWEKELTPEKRIIKG